ncbi:Alpha/Beta hydrolase protein, partial [Phlyctochytrium arcticum]
VVLWHGMGDDCCNPESMDVITGTLREELPGVYVHSIRIGENRDEDRQHSFFDRIDRQIQEVCQQLKADEALKDGFNAIGFSQGGQFLRAYVQYCNDPPVHNLITYGAQHAGVSEWPGCRDKGDINCSLARALLLRGAYIPAIQNRVVQAQYYRDYKNPAAYLQSNIFLPMLNNELEIKNSTFKKNLQQLNKFVMLSFADDDMVVPKESASFGILNEEGELVPLKDQLLYTEDWLGLRQMERENKLQFHTIPGKHVRNGDGSKTSFTAYL